MGRRQYSEERKEAFLWFVEDAVKSPDVGPLDPERVMFELLDVGATVEEIAKVTGWSVEELEPLVEPTRAELERYWASH
jgi:hypothetical protein